MVIYCKILWLIDHLSWIWCFLKQQGVVQEWRGYTERFLTGCAKLDRVVAFTAECFVSALRMRLLRLQG